MKTKTKRNIALWLKQAEERSRHINRNIIVEKVGKCDPTLFFTDDQDHIKRRFKSFKESQENLKKAIENLNKEVFKDQLSNTNEIPRLNVDLEFCPYKKYYILDEKYFNTERLVLDKLIEEVQSAKKEGGNHQNLLDEVENAAWNQNACLCSIRAVFNMGYVPTKCEEPQWRTKEKEDGWKKPNDDRRVLQLTDDAAPDPVTNPIPIDSDEDEDMGVNNDCDDDDFVQTTKRSRSRSPANDTRSFSLRQRTDINDTTSQTNVQTSQTNVPSLFKRSTDSSFPNPQEIVSVEPSVSSLYTASLIRPIYLKLNEDTAIAASDLQYECKKDETGKFVQSGKMIYSSFDEIFGKDTYGEIIHGAEPGMDYWYKHEDKHVRITELKKIFDMEIFEMDGMNYGIKKVSDDTEIMVCSMKIHEQSRADFQAGKITITKKLSLV